MSIISVSNNQEFLKKICNLLDIFKLQKNDKDKKYIFFKMMPIVIEFIKKYINIIIINNECKYIKNNESMLKFKITVIKKINQFLNQIYFTKQEKKILNYYNNILKNINNALISKI